MASFFFSPEPLTFAVEVKGAVYGHQINVPVVLTGTVTRQITGTIETPVKLGQRYTLSDKSNAALVSAAHTIEVPVELKALLNATQSGAGAGSLTYDNVIGVPIVLSEKAGVGALASGGPGDNVIGMPVILGQTFTLSDESNAAPLAAAHTIEVPVTLTGEPTSEGNLRSPALVHFDGTNFLQRTAGTGPGDNDLSGQANFSAVVVFDPELVYVGQACTVVAKDDGSSQRAWRVAWDDTTGLVTVTVCASADGSNRSERSTTTPIRTRTALGFTWDSTDLHLYVDGSLDEGAQTDTGTPGAMATSTEPLSFGAHDPSGGGTDPMIGAVYMLAVFDVTLSATDIAKVRSDGSIDLDVLTGGDLVALWHPDQIVSNGTTDTFYIWEDQISGLALAPGFVSGGALPHIIPSDATAPHAARNRWNINFTDTGFRPQNLTSTYALSTTHPIRRLHSGAATEPNIAAGSNWRRFKNDVTIFLFGFKPSGTTNLVLMRCYGFELLYTVATQTLVANVGVDTSLTSQNDQYVFGVNTIPGFGTNTAFTVVARYNSSADVLDVFVNGVRYTATPVGTDSYSDAFGLLLADETDYVSALAFPAALSAAAIEELSLAQNGEGYPIEFGQYFRYVPQGQQEGLSQLYPDYTLRFPTDPDPPAVITPLYLDRITQLAILPPSVIFPIENIDFPYVDNPYPVREAETIDDEGEINPIFGDPLPTVISVTADVGHNVVAVANAGPTDAGQVISWWEVEYADGNVETFVQIDYNGANDFSVNRNHTDTFVIPLGLDFREKRIRFVIQAVADATQIWKSTYLRMGEGDEFDNNPVEQVIIPGPNQPSPPTISDLEISLNQQALVLKRQEEARSLTLQIAANSRYKLTRPFLDEERDVGVEFELMSVLDDFYRVGTDFRMHRVRRADIGFLDRLAVEYYGPGSEPLWWAIAYANAIVDPEQDMALGQALLIPSRTVVQRFLARRPTR